MSYKLEDYTHTEGRPHSHVVYGDAPLQFLEPLAGKRVLDVGCGNGFWASRLKAAGADVIGVDPSEQGIAIARKNHPAIRFEQVHVHEGLCTDLGVAPFDAVTSFEVVEHLYDPRSWARSCFAALRPGGLFLCSTPYHGYLKNVALAASGSMDKHFTVLWDGGHIKFWSVKTLSALLTEAGFRDIQWKGYGRLPYLWMGMVLVGKKPG
ncbi:MAG TPA: class I SAM-dependent methyltransferase [Phycisphaerales bacterium]|nr:class I SAM-dependent methyltransferase [Phycisphaerales bacterium]